MSDRSGCARTEATTPNFVVHVSVVVEVFAQVRHFAVLYSAEAGASQAFVGEGLNWFAQPRSYVRLSMYTGELANVDVAVSKAIT